MDNYQLYKTSVLLGGQMKMDLILNSSPKDIYINDFHITPISKYVPYNRHSERNLLLYDHQNNISDFYKNTFSSFYENFITPQMNHNWPMIDNTKIYDDTFYAGCSRMNYNIYQKQFEILCPVWLEKLGKDNYLAFDIQIRFPQDERIIAARTISFKHKGVKFHDKFVDYINKYFKYIGIDEGCDDVINIDLSHLTAHLRGLDLQSGNIVTRNIQELPRNLMLRERPLLEYDYMITSSYKDTKTIIPNLLNFNFCFNIEDIFTKNIATQLQGKPIIVGISTKIMKDKAGNDELIELLDKRDLYTNFDYIPKKLCDSIIDIDKPEKESNHPNVLNYLHDDKYISHMDKNKIIQKIPHWQLVNNDLYLFNSYEGFRGYLDEKVGVVVGDTYITEQPVNAEKWMIAKGYGRVLGHVLIMNEGVHVIECYNRYSDTPDIIQDKYSRSLNNMGWAKCLFINPQSYKYINYSSKLIDKYATEYKSGWVGYLYFNYKESDKIKVILGYCNNEKDFNNSYALTDLENTIYIEELNMFITTLVGDPNTLFICGMDKNYLTFASMRNILKKESSKEIIPETLKLKLSILYNIMDSVKPLYLVTINNRLGSIRVDSPDLSSDEIEYKKINNDIIYMARYDGKIKPSMPPLNSGYRNYIYNKKKLNEIQKPNPFMRYINSGYQPLYPSIGFWSYEKQFIDYKIPPKYVNSIEYKWFDSSKIIYTVPEISMRISSPENDINTINNTIKNELKRLMSIKDNIMIDYIFNLYNINYNLIDNIGDTYNYKIKMNFK